MESEKYLPELMAEKDTLDPSFQHSLRLLEQEIEKIQKDEGKEEERFIDVVINKNMKLGQKVLIPVKQFPKFNFVGKLLGPRGNSLKRLQEDTLTKMSILGKGSMRDKEKEEELRQSGEAKYQHLNEDLHVLIEVFAPPAEAYARMGHALEEIKKFLIPDYNDEIRQAQLQELTYLNGGSEDAKVPSVRGKSASRGRGTPAPGPPRSRGGVPPLHAAVPRGAAPRGAPPSRAPSSRGRGVQRARGAPPTAGYRQAPPIVQDTYGEYVRAILYSKNSRKFVTAVWPCHQLRQQMQQQWLRHKALCFPLEILSSATTQTLSVDLCRALSSLKSCSHPSGLQLSMFRHSSLQIIQTQNVYSVRQKCTRTQPSTFFFNLIICLCA
uniref:K Homology domain-containing protein n=1 Tax=Mola mola TaxID=94237 RepID=A0A3Q3XLP0_MOLML